MSKSDLFGDIFSRTLATSNPSFNGITNNGAAQKNKDVTANSSTAYTIDPANGTSFGITLNAASPVLTLASNPPSAVVQQLIVNLIQDGTGGRVPSWSNVTWFNGVAPTINQTAGTTTTVTFEGTSRGWLGFYGPQSSDFVTLGGLTVTEAGQTALKGTVSANNAGAGYIGEVISSSVDSGSAVALTTATIATVTSITLTAGDWEIYGVIIFGGGAVNATQSQGFFGTASGNSSTGRDLAKNTVSSGMGATTGSDLSMAMPVFRVNINSTTTYYLKANSTFTMGATAYGTIEARRVR